MNAKLQRSIISLQAHKKINDGEQQQKHCQTVHSSGQAPTKTRELLPEAKLCFFVLHHLC